VNNAGSLVNLVTLRYFGVASDFGVASNLGRLEAEAPLLEKKNSYCQDVEQSCHAEAAAKKAEEFCCVKKENLAFVLTLDAKCLVSYVELTLLQ